MTFENSTGAAADDGIVIRSIPFVEELRNAHPNQQKRKKGGKTAPIRGITRAESEHIYNHVAALDAEQLNTFARLLTTYRAAYRITSKVGKAKEHRLKYQARVYERKTLLNVTLKILSASYNCGPIALLLGSVSTSPRSSDFTEEYEKNLKNNFNNVMDEFFGGNDSDEMYMEMAEKITGMSYLDPRI
ncbi:hypothetical protein FHL15_008282 [Xylaria flabelliformis]|uniref:Uncharacterized protein n=1 Tax=Xylaria flabelliformis TaxID=2512241 RepID=A0A553HSF2_9PEZI|nr:hypothetical protein FHL15_008282 [Xylaria flabelliformis]